MGTSRTTGDWTTKTGGLLTKEGVCGGGEKGLSTIVMRGLDVPPPLLKRLGEALDEGEVGDRGISTIGLGERVG